MIDWSPVFDECHPEAGASPADLSALAASLAEPPSRREIDEINASQTNPFPPGDSLFATWRPFDASRWRLPAGRLPTQYLSFLAWSNGGDFRTGERWFNFFPAAGPHGVRSIMLAYHVPEYMFGAVPFAFNGAGTFYLFDMRQPAVGDEYPIFCAAAGALGWEPETYCARVADSFQAACTGRIDVDSIRFAASHG